MITGCLKNVFAMVGCVTVLIIGLIAAFIFRAEIAAFVEERFGVSDRVEEVIGMAEPTTGIVITFVNIERNA